MIDKFKVVLDLRNSLQHAIGFYETITQNTLRPFDIFEMWSAIFFALKNARDNKILFTFQLLNKTMKMYNSERNRSYLRYF